MKRPTGRRDRSIRGCARGLSSDDRGANLVEYIIVVGVIALVAMAGFRAFGAVVNDKATTQAHCVETLDPSTCSGAGTQRDPSSRDGLVPVGTTTSASKAEPPLNVDLKNVKYVSINGNLFTTGQGDTSDIDPDDISQGNLGDCYFMSAVAELAMRRPEVLRNAIKQNPDGTYTVTLYEKAPWYKPWNHSYTAVEVNVTPTFPSVDGTNPVFAQSGDRDQNGNRELWPMVLEKAYAQQNGGYGAIGKGGWGSNALAALTGQESETMGGTPIHQLLGWNPNFNDIADKWERGEMLTAGTYKFGSADLFQKDVLVKQHEYYITNVDRANKTITVRNPWGWNAKGSPTTLTVDEFKKYFASVSSNPGPKKGDSK